MANEAAGGAGAPAGGNTEQGAGGGQQQQQQNAPGGGQQPVAGAGAGGQQQNGGQQGGYSYKEDRSDWIPRHRLNEATGKLTTELETLKTQIAEQGGLTTRLRQALTGEPSDADKQQTEIKDAILAMFPGLKAIGDLTPEQIQEVLEAGQHAQQSSHNHWKQHATRMFDSLQSEVLKTLGGDKLTDTQVRRLRSAYRDELGAAVQARQAAEKNGTAYDATNDALSRHEAGDLSFVKEFAKQFLDDWFEPARRTATQQALRRQRPVPAGGRQVSNVTTKLPEIDYNNEDAFKKALAEARGQG